MFGVDPTRDAMPSAICTETELTPWPGGARQVSIESERKVALVHGIPLIVMERSV